MAPLRNRTPSIHTIHVGIGAFDFTIAAGLFAVSLVIAIGWPSGRRGLDVLGIALLLLQTAPLAVRRRWPLAVLVVTGTGIVLYSLFEYPLTVAGTAVLFAFYTVVVETGRRTALAVAAIAAVGITISLAAARAPVETFVSTYGVYAAVFLLGDNVRLRRAFAAEAAARLEAVSHERDERELRIVADERVRLARELHDVVSHHVSVIVIQAGAGSRAMEGGGSGASQAFAAIGSTGRLALDELRRMLGLLRTAEATSSTEIAPQSGLARLDELIAQVGEAGLRVDLRVEGERVDLPAGIDLTAYRILQEALTNVLRHAATDSATVRLSYGGELVIEVANPGGDGGRASLRGTGQGLVGMRERVALYGGSIEAGPVTGGGYAVVARLPLGPTAAASPPQAAVDGTSSAPAEATELRT